MMQLQKEARKIGDEFFPDIKFSGRVSKFFLEGNEFL